MCQFGFKKGHLTSLGCSVLKHAINYYQQNGSYVFACFLDLRKAFDMVNHQKLFNKLVNLNVHIVNMVKLLIYSPVDFTGKANMIEKLVLDRTG